MNQSSTPSHTGENIVWHHGTIGRAERQTLLGQRGCTVWFTGLSGSGKSTVAVAVEAELTRRGRASYRLDGDNVRHGLCSNLGFSAEDRDENIRRIGEVAKLFADAGLITLCSFVSPFRAARDRVRRLHEDAEPGLPFFEVFVDVPLEVAESRDPKGLYKKARAGEIPDFTGVHQAFEAPPSPELVLPTHELSLQDSAARVVARLEAAGVFAG